MKVSVILFASLKEAAGQDRIELDLVPPVIVGSVRQALAARFPRLTELVQRSMMAVNEEYAPDDAPVEPQAELACIPPVSGGMACIPPVSGGSET